MSALGRLLTEALVKIQKFIKSSAAHHIHNALVVVRALLRVAVGSLLTQLVGQIAAADKNHPSVELVRSLLNHLSKAVMLRKRQSGQADPDELIVPIEMIHVIQGDHCPMVEFSLPFPQCSGRKTGLIAALCELCHELRVILHVDFDLRCAELTHISLCSLPRRDVEVIRIQDRMRRGQDNRIRP